MSAEVYAEDGYYAVIPEWVLDADVSAQAIRLYAVLRRYADHRTMHAHPSRRTLAARLRVADVKVVDRALADLERVGAVSVTRRPGGRDDGGQTSNVYVLRRAPQLSPYPQGANAPGVAIADTPGGSNAIPPGRESPSPQGVSTSPPRVETPHELQPLELQPLELPCAPTRADAEDDGFAEWWKVYPNKRGKIKARQAYAKALRKVGRERLLAAVQRYAADPNLPPPEESAAIPYPSTWLNEGRWDDPPLPPRLSRTRPLPQRPSNIHPDVPAWERM
jgi:hypothetical protein